jgi:hypothetical protein
MLLPYGQSMRRWVRERNFMGEACSGITGAVATVGEKAMFRAMPAYLSYAVAQDTADENEIWITKV